MDTGEVVDHFNAAFNAHDLDAVMALMTEDVVFESTLPTPDGRRYEGQAEVRAYWEEFFASSPPDSFRGEETIDMMPWASRRLRTTMASIADGARKMTTRSGMVCKSEVRSQRSKGRVRFDF